MGGVCYLLQAGREAPVWFQTLGEDQTPVLLQDHKLVVKTSNGYENAENAIRLPQARPATSGGRVYDLTGRRVSQGRRGIYIMDGKKIPVK